MPPGYSAETLKRIKIPRYPHDPLRNENDEYVVNLNWLLYLHNQPLQEDQLRVIVSWYATLSSWSAKTEIARKAVKAVRFKELKRRDGKADTFVKEHLLPTDIIYVEWELQAKWLDAMVASLGRIMPLLQTFNANRRTEQPYQTL